MPIGDIDIPGIGKEVVIAMLAQSHIFHAAFIAGISILPIGMALLPRATRRETRLGSWRYGSA